MAIRVSLRRLVSLGIGVFLVFAVAQTTTPEPPPPTPATACSPILYGEPEELPVRIPSGTVNTLDAVDINGDGWFDILMTLYDFQSTQVFEPIIYLNNGGGGFELATSEILDGPSPLIQQASHIVFADFNGDGAADFFVPDFGQDVRPWPGYQNTLVLSTPDGHLVDATANLPQQVGCTHSATAADIDNDGDVDLYIGNMQGKPMTPPQIWLNDGTGNFTVSDGRLPWRAADNRRFVYTAGSFVDVNNDGSPDLVLGGHYDTPESLVLINDGRGFFSVLPDAFPSKPFDPENITLLIEPASVDGDAYQDLMVVYTLDSYAGRYIQILINNGDGTFRDETDTRLPQADNRAPWIKDIELVDIDNDGDLDITTKVPWSPWETQPYYLNDGNGFYCEPHITHRLSGPAGTLYAFIDLYGDGSLDTISTNFQNKLYLMRDLGCTDQGSLGEPCRTATAAPKVVPEFSPQLLNEGHVVYDDTLSPEWSVFSTNAIYDTDSANEVLIGVAAIEVTWEDGGVFGMGKWDRPLDISDYTWLVFNIHGGSTADQQLMLGLSLEGLSVGPFYDLSGYLETRRLEPGQWHQIAMPLDALNIAGTSIDGITLIGQNMLQARTFYLDDIRFVASEIGAAPPRPSADNVDWNSIPNCLAFAADLTPGFYCEGDHDFSNAQFWGRQGCRVRGIGVGVCQYGLAVSIELHEGDYLGEYGYLVGFRSGDTAFYAILTPHTDRARLAIDRQGQWQDIATVTGDLYQESASSVRVWFPIGLLEDVFPPEMLLASKVDFHIDYGRGGGRRELFMFPGSGTATEMD